MKKLKITPLICSIAVLLLSVVSAQSASWNTCNGKKVRWRTGGASMGLNTISFPANNSYEVRTRKMMGAWNAVAGSRFKFYYWRDTDGSYNNGDGKNEIYWANLGAGGYLGHTKTRWRCGWLNPINYFLEADIAMNSSYKWTTAPYTGAKKSQPYNFDLVMLHELGHALGLNHSNYPLSSMVSLYPNSGPLGYYHKVEPHADDRWGAKILYSDNTYEQDLAASRFHRHGATTYNNRVKTANGAVTTQLKSGTPYYLDYTVTNLGTNAETNVNVHFYFSTNRVISKGDTYVGSAVWSMLNSPIIQATKGFYVNVKPGKYYVGYLIDPFNLKKNDSNRSNNMITLLDPVYVR